MKKLSMVLAAGITAAAAFFALSSLSVSAGDSSAVEAAKDRIAKALDVPKENIRPSPVAGLFEVQHEHDFGYVTTDGKYLLQGDLVNIETGEQLTENRRRADRLLAMKGLNADDTILFSPKAPFETKYTVTVFTDVDCHYCQMLHSQMADYNAAGIAIRYAFYPRSGPNTESWKKAEEVWCSDDRKAALTKAKQGGRLAAKSCANPIKKEYEMAEQLGLRGTPMLILPNGDQVMGYLPPKVLAARLATADSTAKPKV